MDKRMLRQDQDLQAKLVKAQEELGNVTVEASAGGGAVTVVADGHQGIHSIKISPEAVDPEDVGLLEDLMDQEKGGTQNTLIRVRLLKA